MSTTTAQRPLVAKYSTGAYENQSSKRSNSEAISEIKRRLTIEEVVRPYTTLRREGAHLKGICPLHSEKSPSFTIYAKTNSWYCFGCDQGGDLFTFLMLMDGITFSEALRRLAAQAGVSLQTGWTGGPWPRRVRR